MTTLQILSLIGLGILVLIIILFYVGWARSKAATLILTFLGESLLIKNVHPDRRPNYIVKKAKKNIKSIPLLARPLALWYIKNRGIDVATAFLSFIVKDLQSDESIELII
jgi:hypothetical protein